LAEKASATGGALAADANVNARGAAPSFGTHICDVEVDPETGKVDVIRYTVCQDAGRALHKAYVEGQFQGGAAQGIGWALNEEYVYGDDGVLQNAGFLDYRMPVALDLPMIDTVIVEVPNPKHPYGVRGVGENGIVAPLAAVTNAIYDATGVRLYSVPMTPPKVHAGIAAHASQHATNGVRSKQGEPAPVGA
jgi:CO/xanthine dehydrogenase Mo-binding subunit